MITSHIKIILSSLIILIYSLALSSCMSPEPGGLAKAQPAETTVKLDFYHKPLPEIPLPNNIATRYDEDSATGRRINSSMIAPTKYESRVRELLDQMDGWGVFQAITIPFTNEIDVESLLAGHRDTDYRTDDDVIYLIDIDPASPEYGKLHYLDIGNGNYPVVLEELDRYWKNDPRNWTLSLYFEEEDEDKNGNGVLDPGEDTDSDGVLDKPNYLPGKHPDRDDLAGRADALMEFYERETHTIMARPLEPLRERTTYAVVVTRRLKDASGKPVGSPYPFINHNAQTEELKPLLDVLPASLALDDIAFTFSFTTQSIESHWKAVRDGLYGQGVQKHLGEEFPARIGGLEILRDPENNKFKDIKNPYILHGEEWATVFGPLSSNVLGMDENTVEFEKLMDSLTYIDYHVIGWFDSPQLFAREDESGEPLGLNDQSWPPDLDRLPANARSEKVYFHLTVPRKEISVRGKDEPAPLLIMSHGYGSNRFEMLQFGGYLAKFGVATLSIDCVSHGIGLNETEESIVDLLFSQYGLGKTLEAILKDRAADQNDDGRKDSGADFWTAYLFHTRDVVRQSALDYMQLMRIVKTFDGERRWDFDLNGDGENELAGDFDGDGVLDVGGDTHIAMMGASLGGIMSSVVGGVEPNLDVIVPVSAGGGLGDVGMRSAQGGVREAIILRVFGPLYVGTPNEETGKTVIETIIPDLNSDATLALAETDVISLGDSVVVENKVNGKRGCSIVAEDGTFRLAVETDLANETVLSVYSGNVFKIGGERCEINEGASPVFVLDTFEKDVSFQGKEWKVGQKLEALAEGFGRSRATPEFRRFLGLGQMVLDGADPAVYARHWQVEPIEYGTGEKTGVHTVLMTTLGDMNVPVSGGGAIGRAAGLIEYLEDDPRYGKPANQVLIDTYTYEAVHTLKRYTDSEGRGVHIDIENFSQSTDYLGEDYPRLDPPLRLKFDDTDVLGGKSVAIFPLPTPQGMHGFDFPGVWVDKQREKCQEECEANNETGCGCDTLEVFDLGNFLFNFIGRYVQTNGAELNDDLCNSYDTCDYILPPPESRGAGFD